MKLIEVRSGASEASGAENFTYSAKHFRTFLSYQFWLGVHEQPFSKKCCNFSPERKFTSTTCTKSRSSVTIKEPSDSDQKSDPVRNKSQCVIGNNQLNSNIYLNDLHNLNQNGFLLLELSIF